MTEPRNIAMAVTGAGGTAAARHVLSSLVRDDRVAHVDLMVSATGRKLIAHELGGPESGDPAERLLASTHVFPTTGLPARRSRPLPSPPRPHWRPSGRSGRRSSTADECGDPTGGKLRRLAAG